MFFFVKFPHVSFLHNIFIRSSYKLVKIMPEAGLADE